MTVAHDPPTSAGPPPLPERDHAQPREDSATDGGNEVLPPGWEVARSRSTGDTYYVNSVTGFSTFDRPTTPAAEAVYAEADADLRQTSTLDAAWNST